MNRAVLARRARQLGADVQRVGATVFDLLPLPAVILTEHGAVLAANAAWEQLVAAIGPLDVLQLGTPAPDAEAIDGAPLWELLKQEPAPALPQLAYCVCAGERWFEVRITRTGWRTRTWIATCEDISEQRLSKLSAARARDTMRAGPDALIVIDFDALKVVEVNDIACQILGRSRTELLALPPHEVFASSAPQLRANYEDLIKSGLVDSCDVVTYRPDGTPVSLELRRRALQVRGRWLVLSTARAVAVQPVQRGRQRQELQHQLLARFGQFVLRGPVYEEVVTEAVEVLRRGLGVELCRVLELSADNLSLTQIAGRGWLEDAAQEGAHDPCGETAERFASRPGGCLVVDDYQTETRISASPLQRAHGVRSSVEALISGVKGTYGLVGAFAREPKRFDRASADFVQSIANTLAAFIERKTTEERLAYMAQFDALTGLPNRTLYLDRLTQTLIEASRDRRPVAVLFVDIDRFKIVNDTLGHAVGDQLLIHVAQRLLGAVRPADTVGRLGGDEFAVALAHLAHAEDAGAVARKIVAALAEPFHLEAQSVYVSASVGISVHPDDGVSADELLKNADTAMYRVKEEGRNGLRFFVPNMHERAMNRARTEARLRVALTRDEYLLHFQPRFHVQSGRVCGLEALLRWRCPETGLMLPGEFIPVLEDSGLIVGVGEWIVAEACMQIRRWQASGMVVPPLAINLTAKQFRQRDLPAVIDKVLAHTGVPASRLELELTESALMSDAELAPDTLRRLRARGLKVALDDFGTGYSSLTYLRRFPLDAIKIDRTFIREAPRNTEDAAMVTAVINVAHSLKLRTVAEGVETSEQMQFLRDHGCDEAQGYFLARPMTGDAVASLLSDETPQSVNLN